MRVYLALIFYRLRIPIYIPTGTQLPFRFGVSRYVIFRLHFRFLFLFSLLINCSTSIRTNILAISVTRFLEMKFLSRIRIEHSEIRIPSENWTRINVQHVHYIHTLYIYSAPVEIYILASFKILSHGECDENFEKLDLIRYSCTEKAKKSKTTAKS